MSGTADTRTPGESRVDIVGTNPLELTASEYYTGLSTWDSYRVSLFVHMIRRASEGTEWKYGVMAFGSTTRPEDRVKAHDIDLMVLITSPKSQRIQAVEHVRDVIRSHYERLGISFQEHEQTFRIGGQIIWESGGYGGVDRLRGSSSYPDKDPSFVIPASTDTPGLPLHICVNGQFGVDAQDKIDADRAGDRSFAVLL